MRIQIALGKNAKQKHPEKLTENAKDIATGQMVLESIQDYINYYTNEDDGSDLANSIYSGNLAKSARFSAKSARLTYLLGKVTLLDADSVKAIVRTQIIEYGSIAEAILLDLIQSVGINDKPAGLRPAYDASELNRKQKQKTAIDWAADGIFTTNQKNKKKLKYNITFHWLTEKALQITAIDSQLKTKLDNLRESRNLVHAATPTPDRYTNNLNSAKSSRETVKELRDAVIIFKQKHGLPMQGQK